MNETQSLDLSFLADMPRNRILYSMIHGYISFDEFVKNSTFPLRFTSLNVNTTIQFSLDGKFFNGLGECVLFPSKEVKDWSRWQEVLIKPGDYIKDDSSRIHRVKHNKSLGITDTSNPSVYLPHVCINKWASEAEIKQFKLTHLLNDIKQEEVIESPLLKHWKEIRLEILSQSSNSKDDISKNFSLVDIDDIMLKLSELLSK